ncbi:hypothetical protein Glove_9g365 [Diversispora epigaea]|uniref:Uncharacterized protein n=1 Tax=Diversispora epigaea TaxID=1348612 RepID=A0A397JX12_9GLOM|nr:hypothetical protein Glove_9g365 [Diversispora epigaea]
MENNPDSNYRDYWPSLAQESKDNQETSTRASDLATNFLSTLSLTTDIEMTYIKRENESTPDKVGSLSFDSSKQEKIKDVLEKIFFLFPTYII